MQKEFMNKMHRIVVSKEYMDAAAKTQRRTDRTKTISYKVKGPTNSKVEDDSIVEKDQNKDELIQNILPLRTQKSEDLNVKSILRGASISKTTNQVIHINSNLKEESILPTIIEESRGSSMPKSRNNRTENDDEIPRRKTNKSKSIYVNNAKLVEDLKKTLSSQTVNKSVDVLIACDINKQTDSMKLKLQERKSKNIKKSMIRNRLSIEKNIAQGKLKKRKTHSKSPTKDSHLLDEYKEIKQHKMSIEKRIRSIKTKSTNENYFKVENFIGISNPKKIVKSDPSMSDDLNSIQQLVKDSLIFELNSKTEEIVQIINENMKVKVQKYKELQETQTDFEIMSKVSIGKILIKLT